MERLKIKNNKELRSIIEIKYRSNPTSIDVSDLDVSEVTDFSDAFYKCENLKEIKGLETWDTSNASKMYGMFSNCKNLRELNLSSFNTIRVVDMDCMFSNCKNLSKLDLTWFDTSLVHNMHGMFSRCKELKELDLSNFDTSSVDDIDYIFEECPLADVYGEDGEYLKASDECRCYADIGSVVIGVENDDNTITEAMSFQNGIGDGKFFVAIDDSTYWSKSSSLLDDLYIEGFINGDRLKVFEYDCPKVENHTLKTNTFNLKTNPDTWYAVLSDSREGDVLMYPISEYNLSDIEDVLCDGEPFVVYDNGNTTMIQKTKGAICWGDISKYQVCQYNSKTDYLEKQPLGKGNYRLCWSIDGNDHGYDLSLGLSDNKKMIRYFDNDDYKNNVDRENCIVISYDNKNSEMYDLQPMEYNIKENYNVQVWKDDQLMLNVDGKENANRVVKIDDQLNVKLINDTKTKENDLDR